MEDKDIKIITSNCVKNNKVAFKKHAFVRMEERNIHIVDILSVLEDFEIVKKYDEDKPFPSYLILGFVGEDRPIHIVLAIDEKDLYTWIITVYEPDKDLWDAEFKRRK